MSRRTMLVTLAAVVVILLAVMLRFRHFSGRQEGTRVCRTDRRRGRRRTVSGR